MTCNKYHDVVFFNKQKKFIMETIETKEDILKYCEENGVEVQSGDNYVGAAKKGVSERGKKISVKLSITQDVTEKTWNGSCIGLGKDIFIASAKEAIDAYKVRTDIYGLDLD